VLVLNDHGLGDTIQFFRYLPLMRAVGVDAAFACPPRLRRLMSSKGGARFADPPPRQDEFDAQIAISSLPYAFGARLDTIPAAVPYLAAEPGLRETWARRMGAAGFKIDIVWQGNPDPEADRARSMPLEAFAPLAEVAGVRLIRCRKARARSSWALCRRRCGSRCWARISTPGRMRSSTRRRRSRRSISSSLATRRSLISPGRSPRRSGSR
jgi:hypothetical protein